MINSNLIDLIANKYVLGSLSVLIALIYAYFKGSASAKQAAEAAEALALAAEQSRLRAAEAKNLFLEKQGAKQNETIDHASTIDQLLGLWDTQQPKSPDSNSNKKP